MTVATGVRAAQPEPGSIPVIRRQERFARIASTNDVVRDWLAAGEPEICLALADEQTAGRGRSGRTWTAPPGAGLLLSLGFRPTWLPVDRVWRLAATVSLAMADAAEEVAGLPDRSIRLKWPNDLVIVSDSDGRALDASGGSLATALPSTLARPASSVRKLGGVLGETDGLGTADPRAIVGIGVNADWPAEMFPPELAGAMTSLGVASGGRPVDLAQLLDAFTSRVEARIEALHGGRFDVADWIDRQVTTGREIQIELPDGTTETTAALRVDPLSGALVVAAPGDADGGSVERSLLVGEVRHVRVAV